MSFGPGQYFTMPDGRNVIVFNRQDLKAHGKVIIHLADSDFNKRYDKQDKPKVLIWDIERYNKEVKKFEPRGFKD